MTTKEVQSPRGRSVTLQVRDDTTDLATIGSTWRLWDVLHDEYGLAAITSTHWMLDIGAHIGSVCIAFLVDNPDAQAVAVEPLAENVAMIRQNADAAGVSDRLIIVEGAVGTDSVGFGPDVHHFIGNMNGGTDPRKVRRVPMAELVKGRRIDFCKIDCEGGEWLALREPAAQKLPLIVGEYHGRSAAELMALLPKHSVTITADYGASGTFRAVR